MRIHYVIGSGPGVPSYQPCSTVYMANGAISRMTSFLCERSVHLITEQMLHKLPDNDKGIARQELLRGKYSDVLVILEAARHNRELHNLEYFGYQAGTISRTSSREKKQITNEFLGSNLALIAMLRGAPFITGLRSIIREFMYGSTIHHSLRVSTGVFAIIYAIVHTPADEKIVISGIGGTSNINVDSGVTYAPNGHMPADRIILDHIGRNYPNVFTTNDALAKTTKIPLHKG